MIKARRMAHWIILWIVAAAIFLAIDLIWLGWLGRGIYQAEIGPLLRQPFNLPAAGAFYVLYITGLMIMVIWPAFQTQSVTQALLRGAMLGLIAYGTYDLTNLAVMKGFTTKIAIIDMIWGTVLTAAVSAFTVLAGTKLLAR